MRNSDPDAAVYWLARMLEAGEDPIYIARRITRFASEDIGLADTNALNVAINVYQACHFIGMPECNVHLAEPVPLVIRNAHTKLMKDLNYGKGYQFAHDSKDKLTTMECLPPSLIGKTYYNPGTQGNEVRFKQRLEQIKEWKKSHKQSN